MSQFELSAQTLGLTAEDMGARTWRAVIAEFIATLLFVFVGAGSVVVVVGVLGSSPGENAGAQTAIALAHGLAIALAHGLAIATLVAATAKISGGHINPAVTLAAVITGRMKLGPGVLYVTGQLIGAIVGALLLKVAIAEGFEGNLGAHARNTEVLSSEGAGLLVEIVLTFVLVFTVFATAMAPGAWATWPPWPSAWPSSSTTSPGCPLPGPL